MLFLSYILMYSLITLEIDWMKNSIFCLNKHCDPAKNLITSLSNRDEWFSGVQGTARSGTEFRLSQTIMMKISKCIICLMHLLTTFNNTISEKGSGGLIKTLLVRQRLNRAIFTWKWTTGNGLWATLGGFSGHSCF